MKREVGFLLKKAENSLVLSIEHFNRPGIAVAPKPHDTATRRR
jgi:hypothetical protein